ncbi:MAG: hypothetical protein H6658_01860 [Ardenticatenaceae bacterium]|nr:hypothetical protein [Ardenticatenaceae bacterium]
MAQWETCEITMREIREAKMKSGLFSNTWVPSIERWEALKTDSSGSQTIYKSEEFQGAFAE